MEALLIYSLLSIIIILGFIVVNLFMKVEKFEKRIIEQHNYIASISAIIGISSEKLKEIDEKGMFKNDDEVGVMFSNIKEIQDILDTYKL